MKILCLGFALFVPLLACNNSTQSAVPAGVSPDADVSVGEAGVASSADAGVEGASSSGDDGGSGGTGDGSTISSLTMDAAGPLPGIAVAVEGAVTSILASPGSLTPAFSSSTYDYYVRCAAGTNAITLTVGTAGGSTTNPVNVVEDQAIVVAGQYWIRCLPHDFPTITVKTSADAGGPTPGWYLLNASTYAIALDTNATPVWYTRGTAVVDVDALTPDTLSFMPNATAPFGYGSTSFSLHDLSAGTVTTLEAVGSPTDDHDLRLLANGDHLILTYPFQAGVDLTGLQSFGTGETIANCEIQELDPSGNLVWSWTATDHIDPVRESIEPGTDTIQGQAIVDPFHCNSLDVDSSGNVLLSARHTNALFYIDRTTGDILWKLGGAQYNRDGADYIQIVDDPETAFSLQHDARFLPNGDISVFDDHGAGGGVARGVVYTLDYESETATVAWQFLGIAASAAEGSCRRYADGETVIGWGYNTTDSRVITEINANGDDVFDVTFAPNTASYRAVKVPLSQLDVNLLRSSVAR